MTLCTRRKDEWSPLEPNDMLYIHVSPVQTLHLTYKYNVQCACNFNTMDISKCSVCVIKEGSVAQCLVYLKSIPAVKGSGPYHVMLRGSTLSSNCHRKAINPDFPQSTRL